MAENILALLRAKAPALGTAERAVAGVILRMPDDIIEMSTADVARLAGVSRPTVVRMCQSLGLKGYQQLRVLLARQAAVPRAAEAVAEPADTPAGIVAGTFTRVGRSVPHMVALLEDADVDAAVRALAAAGRIVCVGYGVSAWLAADAAVRLTSLGLDAQRITDPLTEGIVLGRLGAADVVLAVSGSGSNRLTLDALRGTRATKIALSAFSHAAITDAADLVLVSGMPESGFREEIMVTSRIPQVILVEGLLAAVQEVLGAAGAGAKERSTEVIASFLEE